MYYTSLAISVLNSLEPIYFGQRGHWHSFGSAISIFKQCYPLSPLFLIGCLYSMLSTVLHSFVINSLVQTVNQVPINAARILFNLFFNRRLPMSVSIFTPQPQPPPRWSRPSGSHTSRHMCTKSLIGLHRPTSLFSASQFIQVRTLTPGIHAWHLAFTGSRHWSPVKAFQGVSFRLSVSVLHRVKQDRWKELARWFSARSFCANCVSFPN